MKITLHAYSNTFLLILLLVFTACKQDQHSKQSFRSKQKSQSKAHHKKLSVGKNPDKFQVVDIFVSKQKQNEMKCPDKTKTKVKESGKISYSKELLEGGETAQKASIIRRSHTIEFDIVHVEEKKLDIPAFKQFKNNMTDFTRDGEEAFKAIIVQIREYLGDNTDGRGVTLFITGSASQIPTSFDPTKPDNNINKDGSSVKGKTSIENNRLLALARATELANKITKVFKNIKVVTPTLSDIGLGETQWNNHTQRELDKAYLAGDNGKMMEIFEPFQKDQYVKVESHETFVKTVQPNSIKMYTISFVPRIEIDNIEIEGSFVVSQETFWKVGQNRKFESVKERKEFLKDLNLELMKTQINEEDRWYVIANKEEKEALKTKGEYEKLYALHEYTMVNVKDRKVLEAVITAKYLQENRYKYILKKK